MEKTDGWLRGDGRHEVRSEESFVIVRGRKGAFTFITWRACRRVYGNGCDCLDGKVRMGTLWSRYCQCGKLSYKDQVFLLTK